MEVGQPASRAASWERPAEPASVGYLRLKARGYAEAAGAPAELCHAVTLSVSELATNAVMHAYPCGGTTGPIRLRCARAAGGHLLVEVSDDGVGMAFRPDSPGVGHGLAVVSRLAATLEVTAGPHGRGTTVALSFVPEDAEPLVPSPFEPLCELALSTLADVACLDVVRGGVLRRASARVDGDAELTAWLRQAVPPARPGTATWAALREGGTRLVVHDPSVPRSPGGAGEQLGLQWWIAVPLDGDGEPAAIWGLGGRDGGRPVPSPELVDALRDAARGDLASEAGRRRLRERLG